MNTFYRYFYSPDRSPKDRRVLAKQLAAATGITPETLKVYAHDIEKASPLTALRIELATNGEVCAADFSPKSVELVEVAARVLALRNSVGAS